MAQKYFHREIINFKLIEECAVTCKKNAENSWKGWRKQCVFRRRSIRPRYITQSWKCSPLLTRASQRFGRCNQRATRASECTWPAKRNARRSDAFILRNARDCVRTGKRTRETTHTHVCARARVNENTRRETPRMRNTASLKARKKITNAIERRRRPTKKNFSLLFRPRSMYAAVCDSRDSTAENTKRKSDCLSGAACSGGWICRCTWHRKPSLGKPWEIYAIPEFVYYRTLGTDCGGEMLLARSSVSRVSFICIHSL